MIKENCQKISELLIKNQLNNHHRPPHPKTPRPPTTPTFSKINQSQSFTRISFQKNPYTFEERLASLSETLISAIRHATLSGLKYEPTYKIYPSLKQDLSRTGHPSQNQNQTSTIQRKKNPISPRVHFNIPSSPSPSPLDLSSDTIRSTPQSLQMIK